MLANAVTGLHTGSFVWSMNGLCIHAAHGEAINRECYVANVKTRLQISFFWFVLDAARQTNI